MSASTSIASGSDNSGLTMQHRRQRQTLRPILPKFVKARGTRDSVRCYACWRLDCRLQTHKYYSQSIAQVQPSASTPSTHHETRKDNGVVDSVFEKSYAYLQSQQYVDKSVGASRVDPFHRLPVSVELQDIDADTLLKFYFTVEINHRFISRRPQHVRSDIIFSPVLVPTMSDPTLCLVMLACSRVAWRSSLAKPCDDTDSLTLTGMATKALRAELEHSNAPTDVQLLCMLFLCSHAVYLEYKPAVEMHMSSVRASVKRRGGLDKLGLDGIVASLVRWLDIYYCLLFFETSPYTCSFEALELIQPPPKVNGAAWETSAMIEVIPAAILEMCHQMSALYDLHEHNLKHEPSMREHLHTHQMVLNLAYKRNDLIAQFHGSGTLVECVLCCYVILQIHLLHHSEKHSLLLTIYATALTTAFNTVESKHRDISYRQEGNGLLLWLLFTTFLVQRDFSGKLGARKSLYDIVVKKFGLPGLWPSDWRQQIEQTLQRFTWSKTKLEKPFTVLCNDIEQWRMKSSV